MRAGRGQTSRDPSPCRGGLSICLIWSQAGVKIPRSAWSRSESNVLNRDPVETLLERKQPPTSKTRALPWSFILRASSASWIQAIFTAAR